MHELLREPEGSSWQSESIGDLVGGELARVLEGGALPHPRPESALGSLLEPRSTPGVTKEDRMVHHDPAATSGLRSGDQRLATRGSRGASGPDRATIARRARRRADRRAKLHQTLIEAGGILGDLHQPVGDRPAVT